MPRVIPPFLDFNYFVLFMFASPDFVELIVNGITIGFLVVFPLFKFERASNDLPALDDGDFMNLDGVRRAEDLLFANYLTETDLASEN